MFFAEQPSHVETVVLMSKVNPGVHFITMRKVRKTAAGEVSDRCTSLTIILIVEFFLINW
ncbi:hypothetical protein DW996_10465 [Roseburia sp. AM51-8]|nr:hypothetical protein DW996_10465 [Roseburia sp. AM51-8]